MKYFQLNRLIDETGMSGTGVVAEGVELPNGECVMWWIVNPFSIVIYHSMFELQYIHGHGQKKTTEVIYVESLGNSSTEKAATGN
jgi:hypothetical protein